MADAHTARCGAPAPARATDRRGRSAIGLCAVGGFERTDGGVKIGREEEQAEQALPLRPR
ncbi:hypothetical protein [Sorangium sp. So ce204]|uniref:hypothetical protein n=1 Tax=Sorangium sp. So ce204 TaxID=3133288 RepID=UPI003F5D77CD